MRVQERAERHHLSSDVRKTCRRVRCDVTREIERHQLEINKYFSYEAYDTHKFTFLKISF